MQNIRAVVFDLDGTLVDSLADIAAAVNSTLEAHGRPTHPLGAFHAMVGWGLKRLLATASAGAPFAADEFETVYQELLQAYRARPVFHTRAYPGIAALVAGLGAQTRIGVLSNKEDGMTKTIVAAVFPGTPFGAVWGARPDRFPKPDPSALVDMLGLWSVAPEECAFLGDSDVDMETARGAGCWACGAAWGFRSEAELRGSGAHEVFADAESFGRWLEPRLVLDKTTADTETERGVQP